jgi:hypothetical protein
VPCCQSRKKRFKAALALLEAGESEAMIFTRVDRASRQLREPSLWASALKPSRSAVGRSVSVACSHGDACQTRNHPRDNSVHGPDSKRHPIAEAEDVRLHQVAAREWSGACEAPLAAHWHTP